MVRDLSPLTPFFLVFFTIVVDMMVMIKGQVT